MADLRVGEINSRQIAAFVANLDDSYEHEGRVATWTCKLNSSEGRLIDTAVVDIPAYAKTTSYIFNNLTPATSYFIMVVISGIIGSADKVFYVTQSTATSGGSDYGNLPHIRKFLVEREGIAVPKIKCYLRITNLLAGNNEISLAVYRKSDYTLVTSTKFTVNDKEIDDYVILPDNGDHLEYDVPYIVNLVVTNTGVVSQNAEDEIVLLDIPLSLYCHFNDKLVELDGGRTSVLVYDYPDILASNFNLFWDHVNEIRSAVGLDVIPNAECKVVSGDKMNDNVFELLFDSIDEIYGNVSVSKPTVFINVGNMLLGENRRITPAVISGIEYGLQVVYNHLYKQTEGT